MLTWAEVQMARRKKELAEADFAQFFQDEQVKEGRYQLPVSAVICVWRVGGRGLS